MLDELPPGLTKYSESPVFTEKTVPKKLKSAHTIKESVWGKLKVHKGSLEFVVPGPPQRIPHRGSRAERRDRAGSRALREHSRRGHLPD